MKFWEKTGLIGLIIGFLYALLEIIMPQGCSFWSAGGICGSSFWNFFSITDYFISLPAVLIIAGTNWSGKLLPLFSFINSLIIFGLIGAIIGIIIQKVRK